MKITRTLIKQFEADQVQYGTKVAMHNLLWLNADQQFRDLGITRVRTSTRKAAKKK